MPAPTIKTIAKAANVSTATVSKVLNNMPDISDATKARVRQVCDELGYIPNANARKLSLGTNNTVGVVMSSVADASNAAVCAALSERMGKNGYSLFFCDSGMSLSTEEACTRMMVENGVAALIVIPVSGDLSHIREHTRKSIPVVYVGGNADPERGFGVSGNDRGGAALAAQHLHALGHTHFLMLSHGPETPQSAARRDGFVDFMQRHALRHAVGADKLESDPVRSGIAAAARIADAEDRPTAVFASDDLVAVGLIAALRERGLRVPEDVSVVGYGDLPCSALPLVSLTSIRPPHTELAICAADMAMQLAAGKTDITPRISLEASLVVRSTTARRAE